jgi:protein PET117
MHQGVIRDMEQQRIKRERQLDFDMQKALEEEYKKGQTVSQIPSDQIPDKALPNR